MDNSENRVCPICGKSMKGKSNRALYCSNSCKQEAYRQKNGIEKPEFLKSAPVLKKQIKVNIEEELSKYPEMIAEVQSQINEANAIKNKYLQKLAELEPNMKKDIETINEKFVDSFGGEFKKTVLLGSIALVLNKHFTETPQQKRSRENKRKNYVQTINEADKVINQLTTQKLLLEKQYSDLKEEFKRHFENFLQLKYDEEREEKQLRLKSHKITPISLEEMKALEFDVYELSDDLSGLIGNPAKNFKALIYGSSGSGKTTWVINFANYFAENFGRVLFNSSEEGISLSLRQKLVNSTSENLLISEAKTFDNLELLIDAGEYDLLVVDSVNDMKLTAEQFDKLNALPIAILYILQATKEGNYKGSTKFGHDVDIVLKVDNYELEVEKTRYK